MPSDNSHAILFDTATRIAALGMRCATFRGTVIFVDDLTLPNEVGVDPHPYYLIAGRVLPRSYDPSYAVTQPNFADLVKDRAREVRLQLPEPGDLVIYEKTD